MNRQTITEEIIKGHDINLNDALRTWWWPHNNNGQESLRLTRTGHQVFARVLTPYTFNIDLTYSGKQILQIAKIKSPFFVDYVHGQIVIYSQQLATMIKLYPNFQRYLDLL